MDTGETSAFGSLLRTCRVAAGLSQERLAEQAGLSLRGISDLERGARRSPRLETVRMLADALGLSQEDRASLFRAARRDTIGGPEDSTVVLQPVLPVPPTPLVGRANETALISRLLNDASPRLITLTGTGGVGKTRLALEVAAAVSTAFPDGVCFVPLASVSGPALVVPAVADALGVRKSAGDSLQDELARFLRTKRFLLVLDIFEHVLPAALVVTELLATCAGLKVLATSRVPLQLRGERQVPILPLGVPETEGSRSREDIAESEAVRLFVARGQEVKPEFALNDDNVEAIADICRRLDGLPLALELAAVRVKVLTPYALLRRLELRLPMLIGGARDLPVRHQALRATIAWSYDLLSPEEQTLFRRLAVFIGGWTLEGAKAVVAPEGAFDLFDGLGSLVDKSLVQCADGLDGEPRYLMLETVREFAEVKLVDSGEEDDIGRGHANYCLVLAQAGSQGLADTAVGGWLARMEAEQANIRAALAWLLDHALPEDGLRLANALGGFWGSRSAQDEGRAWIEAFLALPSNTQRMANERVDALRWLGVTSGYEGDLAAAEADLNESLALARQLGDKRGMYMGLGAIAIARTHHGDVAGSMPLLWEGLSLAREQGDQPFTAHLLAYLAFATGHQGDLKLAETLAAESAALARSYGALHGFEATITVMFQGWLAFMGDDSKLAEERFERALALGRARGTKGFESVSLAGLAEIALSRKRIDEAAASYREGLALGWEGKVQVGMVYNLQGLVRVGIKYGDLAHAAQLVGALETYGNSVRALPGIVAGRYEADVADLRNSLGEKAFEAERLQGRLLDRAGIVAEVLGSG